MHKNNKSCELLINEFSKVEGYKISIQKLIAFLYTNNEPSKKKKKTEKKIHFQWHKNNKIAGNKSNQEDFYTENYRTMLKDFKNTNKWRKIHRLKSLKF